MQDAEQAVSQVSAIVDTLKHQPGALLPVLHAVQEQFGYIPPTMVPVIARGLNLSRADVHGVITFYHQFRTVPPGRHIVQLCRAEACQAMGSRQLEAYARARLGVDFGETTADGAITLQSVYCLGNCACPPSVRVDDTIHARVDAVKLDTLFAELVGEA
jgi:formate dehydrogenase subunit gamma